MHDNVLYLLIPGSKLCTIHLEFIKANYILYM